MKIKIKKNAGEWDCCSVIIVGFILMIIAKFIFF